jgi:hypothetical protein
MVIAAKAIADSSPLNARPGHHHKLGGNGEMHGIAIIIAMKRCSCSSVRRRTQQTRGRCLVG